MMKLHCVVLALMMLAVPASVLAQDDWIGLYADDAGMLCSTDIALGETVTLNVFAHVPNYPDGIRAVEFRIENYPVDGAGGSIVETWTAELTIGSPGGQFIAIAWGVPQFPDANGNVLVGTIAFTAEDPDWIGDDYLMVVAESVPRDMIIVVGADFVEYPSSGDQFTFNCSGFCSCLYLTTAAAESSWGAVKALY